MKCPKCSNLIMFLSQTLKVCCYPGTVLLKTCMRVLRIPGKYLHQHELTIVIGTIYTGVALVIIAVLGTPVYFIARAEVNRRTTIATALPEYRNNIIDGVVVQKIHEKCIMVKPDANPLVAWGNYVITYTSPVVYGHTLQVHVVVDKDLYDLIEEGDLVTVRNSQITEVKHVARK